MSIRVLIADDQALVRGGFRRILEAEPDIEVVAEAGDGAEVLELAARHRLDVVLMDIRMPRLDGIEATRRLLAEPRNPPTRVLVLTTFDLDEYVYEALRAGGPNSGRRRSTARTIGNPPTHRRVRAQTGPRRPLLGISPAAHATGA